MSAIRGSCVAAPGAGWAAAQAAVAQTMRTGIKSRNRRQFDQIEALSNRTCCPEMCIRLPGLTWPFSVFSGILLAHRQPAVLVEFEAFQQPSGQLRRQCHLFALAGFHLVLVRLWSVGLVLFLLVVPSRARRHILFG